MAPHQGNGKAAPATLCLASSSALGNQRAGPLRVSSWALLYELTSGFSVSVWKKSGKVSCWDLRSYSSCTRRHLYGFPGIYCSSCSFLDLQLPLGMEAFPPLLVSACFTCRPHLMWKVPSTFQRTAQRFYKRETGIAGQ